MTSFERSVYMISTASEKGRMETGLVGAGVGSRFTKPLTLIDGNDYQKKLARRVKQLLAN